MSEEWSDQANRLRLMATDAGALQWDLSPNDQAAISAALARLAALETENERLREGIGEAIRQIEYLHGKFQETGSGVAVLGRLQGLVGHE